MPNVPAFHSVQQAKRPVENRIYHDNDRCFSARDIPGHDRREGAADYRLCVECARLNAALRSAASIDAVAPIESN
jgi:hypothetical protein